MTFVFEEARKSNLQQRQSGATLIFLIFIIALAATTYSLKVFDASDLKAERDKRTGLVLAEAKAALLGYAASQNLNTSCTTNCPRPGDLPCPDSNNDGSSDACSLQNNRIGRLPWKTLGLADLRDGSGERLWYAVSTNYKNNPRIFPLNSHTLGTISLHNSSGSLINNASLGNGLVAVIFSAGTPLVREDGYSQVRDVINENNPINYLDVAFGEDNADFADSDATNGLIMGYIQDVNGKQILNDRLLVITREEMISVMESRVLGETLNNLLDFYCGGIGNADYTAKACLTTNGPPFFPNPANFNDVSCLGYTTISSVPPLNCAEGTQNHGRIPAYPATAWTDRSSSSIFRATSTGNWFQQNGWRELIHYAVAPACIAGTTNCTGSGGFLTLNNALGSSINKKVVLVASGSGLVGQSRIPAGKLSENNYLEGENLTVTNNIYVRTSPLTNVINDRAVTLP